ncbi:MAG: hypothetical protein ACYC8T_18615 [Myxococcaceae bacterium]
MSKLRALYERIPAGALMSAERLYGWALKRVADHFVGHRLVSAAHGGAGKALGVVATRAGLRQGEDAVSAARLTMETYFAPILTAGEDGKDGDWSFEFTRCPYGLTGSAEGPLCHAIMRLEEGLVRELGGELIIEERIAEGAERCRFRVRNQR